MSSSARVAVSIDAGRNGGTEPDLKRRRLLEAGGPIEDDETARQKMRDARVYERGVDGAYLEFVGFDPDNVRDVKSCRVSDANVSVYNAINPMCYFAMEGDLPMMQWLYVNGADTQDVLLKHLLLMFEAACHGHLHVCKWLFRHGCAGDIKRRARSGYTPLSVTFHQSDKRDLNRWLILKGALCKDDDTGDLDIDLMKEDLSQFDNSAGLVERPELLKWAREQSSFDVFLMGTLSVLPYSATKLRNELLARIRSEKVVDRLLGNTPPDQYPLLWDDMFVHRVCPLAAFSGKGGILELIGDYVGIMRGREARIVRQLTELLPGVMKELDAEQAESDSDDSDDSD